MRKFDFNSAADLLEDARRYGVRIRLDERRDRVFRDGVKLDLVYPQVFSSCPVWWPEAMQEAYGNAIRRRGLGIIEALRPLEGPPAEGA